MKRAFDWMSDLSLLDRKEPGWVWQQATAGTLVGLIGLAVTVLAARLTGYRGVMILPFGLTVSWGMFAGLVWFGSRRK